MDRETKNEFGKVRTEMSAEFDKLNVRLDKLLDNVVTRVEFDLFKEDIFERMATKQQLDEHMVLMDWAVREAKKARDEQDLFSYRFVGLDDQVQIHERRIKKLEKAAQ